MRRALQAPKLRGDTTGETPNQSHGQQPPKQQQPKMDTNCDQIPLRNNPAYSPDDSLAKAASKLANLKAVGGVNMLKAKTTTLAAAPPATTPVNVQLPRMIGSRQVVAGVGAVLAEPELTTSPHAKAAKQGKPTKGEATPGWQPEDEGRHVAKAEDVPLAAKTVLTKRNRRKSVYQRPARYGDWWTGDDTELDQMVQEYNEEEEAEAAAAAAAAAEAERKQKEKARKARRKSAFPAVGRQAAPLLDEEEREELRKPEAAPPHVAPIDVAGQVKAMTDDLCAKLDGLIETEESPKIGGGGRRRQAEDDKSLREKLVESWEGKVRLFLLLSWHLRNNIF